MDSLNDALSTCPTCLHLREISGTGDNLYWVCDCGATSIRY